MTKLHQEEPFFITDEVKVEMSRPSMYSNRSLLLARYVCVTCWRA
jgi:hypothetical protein